MAENLYENYGDVNFFESGLLIRQAENEHEFDFIVCEPIQDLEDQYLFSEGCVNIDDDWIKWDSMQINPKEVEPIEAAREVYYYYGSYEISAGYQQKLTKQEIIDIMNNYDARFDDRPWEQ